MSDQALEFCEKILKKVSRSFALSIPLLDESLYRPVMVTYLQDRLLDNFEDEVEDISLERRKELMDLVSRVFSPGEQRPDNVIATVEKNAYLLSDKWLRRLTENTSLVWEVYNQLEKSVKEFSHYWLEEMNQGMQTFLEKEVETFADLDQYCYYVAGTVGGFLTDLIIEKSKIGEDEQNKLKNNFNDAGLFLQKVNIIRDIKRDLDQRNKNYWPLIELGIDENDLRERQNKNRVLNALNRMIADVHRHLPGLVEYLEAIPEDFSGYRKFYCVNNALGLATLEKMKDNPQVVYGKKKVKVAKMKFLKILGRPEKSFGDLSSRLMG